MGVKTELGEGPELRVGVCVTAGAGVAIAMGDEVGGGEAWVDPEHPDATRTMASTKNIRVRVALFMIDPPI